MFTAIHCAIVSPSGIQYDSNILHRPKFILFSNRWGYEYVHAARFELYKAGIESCFQSREDLVKICLEEGTDPDGNNFLFRV